MTPDQRKNQYARSFRQVMEDVIETGEPRVLYEAFYKVVRSGNPPDLYEELLRAEDNVIGRIPQDQLDDEVNRTITRLKASLSRRKNESQDLIL